MGRRIIKAVKHWLTEFPQVWVMKELSFCLLYANDVTVTFLNFTPECSPLVSCINSSNIPAKNLQLPNIHSIC
jgi:hypothetical protein